MGRTYGQHCGLARALDRIGERWTLLIVRELLIGPARYTDLRDALPGMATNLLAERLRALEDQGIVQRRRLPPPAASTVYELTEMGRGLEEAVSALIRWGGHWMRETAETDVFRPQWLALAVRALTRPNRADGLPLTCRLELGEHAFTLYVGVQGTRVGVDSEDPADVTLASDDPQTVLGLAAGALELDAAVESGAVRVEGEPGAVATLADVWRGRL